MKVAEPGRWSSVASKEVEDWKPRVLWVTPTLSRNFGGPTTTAVNGVIAETGAGLSSQIVTTVARHASDDSQPAVERLRRAGVTTGLFPRVPGPSSFETWGFSPGLAVWLVRNIRAFDVVHLQYVWCMTSLVGLAAAKLARVPVVLTPHESLTSFDIEVASRSSAKKLLKRIFGPLYIRWADRIVFMSELEESDTRGVDGKAIRISHAVCQSPAPQERRSASGQDCPLRIGFLGRNVGKKGIDRLIRAVGLNAGRGWRLLVAGPPATDGYGQELKGLSRSLGVAERVSWLGYLDDRSALFAECDVLAMPSEYEGFGMVAAEAMSHGLPVIVPRQSGIAETVDKYDAGIVIETCDTEHLCAALRRFDSERAKWSVYGENGIRASRECFTFDHFGAATRGLYETLK